MEGVFPLIWALLPILGFVIGCFHLFNDKNAEQRLKSDAAFRLRYRGHLVLAILATMNILWPAFRPIGVPLFLLLAFCLSLAEIQKEEIHRWMSTKRHR